MDIDLSEPLNKAKLLIDQEHFDEAIEKCLKIVEQCLKQLYGKIFTKLNVLDQNKINQKLLDEFEGKRFDDLFVGAKIKIFNEFDLFSKLDIKLEKKIFDELMRINDLRVKATHEKEEMIKGEQIYTPMSKGQALSVYSQTFRFLELIGCDLTINESDKINIKKQDKFVLENLPRREYEEFIGREKEIENIKKLLLHEKVHVLAIDGIGGVGKSALALEIAYQLKNDRIFDSIIWVSAKREILTYNGIKKIDNTFENLEDLLNTILKLNNAEDFVKFGNLETKEKMVHKLLKENRSLLIVDNLETIDDENIKSFIIDVEFPIESKVLITSRKRIGQVERVIYLERFNLDESRHYIFSQLNHKGFKNACSEQIIRDLHKKTGGIPLALRVIIPWIIEGKISDKLLLDIDKETNILEFCFGKVYNEFLSEDAKKLFCVIGLAPKEIDESALKYISRLDAEQFLQSSSSLINYSLIFEGEHIKGSGVNYSMLPLTQEFAEKVAIKDYPTLKEIISKDYFKFLELIKNEQYSAKTAMAISKAEEAIRLHKNQGSKKAVKSLFKEAISYDEKCDYVLYLAAIFSKECGDLPEAKSLIKKALKIKNKNTDYWNEYSDIIYQYEGPVTAEKVLETAVKKVIGKTKKHRFLLIKLIKIKFKLQKNVDIIDLSINNIILRTNNNYEKRDNTYLAASFLEAKWRIAYDFLNNGRKEGAESLLINGLIEIDDLIEKGVIFKDDGGLLWQIKKAYNKLGDLADDKDKALDFYYKSLFERPIYPDQISHNSRVIRKISNISQ
jgi:Tfp pilus assembly protein PilF